MSGDQTRRPPRPGREGGRERGADVPGATAPRQTEISGAVEPGHHDAAEHDLPHESLSPITMAAGIALIGFGLLTSPVFSIVGIATIGWALVRWIGELRHE